MSYRVPAAAAAALALILIAGCVKPDSASSPSGSSKPSVGASATSDEAIARAVRQKLAADASLKNEKIDVQVKDGFVTLIGTVTSDAVRIRADSLVREIPDVNGVNSEKLSAR